MHSGCIGSEVNRKEYVRFTHFCLGMHKLKLLISKNLCLGVSQRHVSGFTAKFLGVYIRKSSTMSEDGQVHHIAKKGFSESSLYNRVRPSYTRESVEYLLKKLGILKATGSENMAQTVLELGAGTGKFTRVMADILRENGNAEDERVRIIATEPLASMKEKFCELCPGIEVLQCPAENIGWSFFIYPTSRAVYLEFLSRGAVLKKFLLFLGGGGRDDINESVIDTLSGR